MPMRQVEVKMQILLKNLEITKHNRPKVLVYQMEK